MRRTFVALCVAIALSASLVHAARAGQPTPTRTEEPELAQPTPSPIDPPPFGDDAASRLLLIDGVYQIVPGPGDCGWAETRRVSALYRNFETVDVVVLTSNCDPADDVYLFYPSSGELRRERQDTPRLRLQLVEGKVAVISSGQPCNAYAESSRVATDPLTGQPGEVAILTSSDGCASGSSLQYRAATGELQIVIPAPSTPGPTVTLPNTGAGVADGLGAWVYVANGAIAALVVAGGLLVVARRRRD